MSTERSSKGRSFHADGPTIEKALRCIIAKWARGTKNSPLAAERSTRRAARTDTGQQRAACTCTCTCKLHIDRARFKENSSLHISSAKAGVYAKMSIYPAKFPNDRFLLDLYCTNSLSSLPISSHHCTFCASLHVKTSPAHRGLHVSKLLFCAVDYLSVFLY